jgi:hypothetical protein
MLSKLLILLGVASYPIVACSLIGADIYQIETSCGTHTYNCEGSCTSDSGGFTCSWTDSNGTYFTDIYRCGQ